MKKLKQDGKLIFMDDHFQTHVCVMSDTFTEQEQLERGKRIVEAYNSMDHDEKTLNGYWFTDERNIEVTVLAECGSYCMVLAEGKEKPYVLPTELIKAIKEESDKIKE